MVTDSHHAPAPVEPSPPLVIEQLLQADAFDHPVERIEMRETHLSWIVLTGRLAYKIKKPLKLEFIDASTLQRRKHFCDEELRLNRSLAPELYLSVVPIRRDGERTRVGAERGEIIEYAVCMRQFDTSSELSHLLQSNRVRPAEIVEFAEWLAHFHQQAHVAETRRNGEAVQERRWRAILGNVADLAQLAADLSLPQDLMPIVRRTYEDVREFEPLLEQRARGGYVRECHGDLHAANIVRWQRRLLPFDCIDFDPELRFIDVIDDCAFLVMDLVSRQRVDLAALLINRYLEITGDYEGVRLLPFYAAHRALVRAKVDAISARQDSVHRPEFQSRLVRRIRAADTWMHRPRPGLVLMHGLSGSGKSWLSEQLVPSMPGIRIRSDLERKRLTPDPKLRDETRYSSLTSHRTYARLLECAENCLVAGFNAIVDATFLDAADRELFERLADRLDVPWCIVSCHADQGTLLSRLEQRQSQGRDPSDADRAVLARQRDKQAPLTDHEQSQSVVIDTGTPNVVSTVIETLKARDVVRADF